MDRAVGAKGGRLSYTVGEKGFEGRTPRNGGGDYTRLTATMADVKKNDDRTKWSFRKEGRG